MRDTLNNDSKQTITPKFGRKAYLESEAKRLQDAVNNADKNNKTPFGESGFTIGRTLNGPSISVQVAHIFSEHYILKLMALLVFLAIVTLSLAPDVITAWRTDTLTQTANDEGTDSSVHTTPSSQNMELKPGPNFEPNSPYAQVNKTHAMMILLDSNANGRKEAFEFLYENNQNLRGLDISCRTLKKWNGIGPECNELVMLQNLNLSGDFSKHAVLDSSKFDRNDLTGSDLSFASLRSTSLKYARLRDVNFSNADLYRASFKFSNMESIDQPFGSSKNVNFFRANLNSSDFSFAKVGGANFESANLSNANFHSAIDIEQADFSESWAWRDMPPTRYRKPIDVGYLCDPKLRPAYQKHQRFGRPKGC